MKKQNSNFKLTEEVLAYCNQPFCFFKNCKCNVYQKVYQTYCTSEAVISLVM